VYDGIPETIQMLQSRGMRAAVPSLSILPCSHQQRTGKRTIFVTNNSTKSRDEYLRKLTTLGIPSGGVEDIFGSAYSSAVYISRILKLPPGKNKVFVIGEEGIEKELQSEGVAFIGGTDPAFRRDIMQEDFKGIADGSLLDPEVGVVLAGLDFHFNYLKMAHGLHYLKRGALFLATNTDSTLPMHHDFFLGAGSAMAPLVNASGQKPLELGKPSQAMMDAVEGKFHLDRSRTCMIGDRLNTDIKFGVDGKLGGTLHVLTGVDNKEAWQKEDAVAVPSFYADRLSDLKLVA
jgi:4-nitrophenyl phosphatase